MAGVAPCVGSRGRWWNKVRVEPALNGRHGLHLYLVEEYPVHIPTLTYFSPIPTNVLKGIFNTRRPFSFLFILFLETCVVANKRLPLLHLISHGSPSLLRQLHPAPSRGSR